METVIKKPKFNFSKLFVIGLGFFGVSVLWSIYNTYVPLLLANRFSLDAGLIGFFMTLDNIAALFIQPLVGSWSDRMRSPLGRRLPFILIGAPVAAVAFGLVPLATALPLFVACTVTTILAMAFWRTPVVALMPDVTPSMYRSQANGIINFMGGLGVVIGTSVAASLVKVNAAAPFWFGSGLMLFAAVLVLIFVREPKSHQPEINDIKPTLLESVKELFSPKNRSGLGIFFAILFWFIAYNAIEAFLSLYGVNFLGLSESDAGRLITSVSFAFLIFAIPSGFIGAKFGRKKTILTGLVIMAAVLVAVFVGQSQNITQVLTKLPLLGNFMPLSILLMLAGIGWSFININSLPMVVDQTDSSRVGTFTGLYYLFSTLAAILGPIINGQIIRLTGNNYGTIMILGPIFFGLAFVAMLTVRKGEAKA
ncbi:MAG TPA: MFS transporter [Anaerolineaceae bacterium]|nr:MFS transporter [Anaerolineaceae bacterium]